MNSCGLALACGPTPLRIAVANSLVERLRGLLGRTALDPHEALLLRRCNAVHTFGMRIDIDIDIVFVGAHDRVVAVHRAVPPARLRAQWRATNTLEMAAGAAARHGIRVGERLTWIA